jgi:predicted DNA-binding protein
MRKKQYLVRLTGEERQRLKEVVTKGKSPAYQIRHANVLLLADMESGNWADEAIAKALSVNSNTVGRIRRLYAQQGLKAALERKKQVYPSRPSKFDGVAEARLIALSCSQPPEGRSRWSLRLLADKAVELEIVDSVVPETIRQTLKKTNLSRT